MNIILPPAQAGLAAVVQAIRQAFTSVVSENMAASRIMLRSPQGKVYQVTVDEAGNLVTEAVDGKSRP